MNLTYLCSGGVKVQEYFLSARKYIEKIKRRNEFLLFAPNLTMNLTYLCSGYVNVERIFLSKKIYSIKFLKKN